MVVTLGWWVIDNIEWIWCIFWLVMCRCRMRCPMCWPTTCGVGWALAWVRWTMRWWRASKRFGADASCGGEGHVEACRQVTWEVRVESWAIHIMHDQSKSTWRARWWRRQHWSSQGGRRWQIHVDCLWDSATHEASKLGRGRTCVDIGGGRCTGLGLNTWHR